MLTLTFGLLWWQLNWVLLVLQGAALALSELSIRKVVKLEETPELEDVTETLREAKRKQRKEEVESWNNEFYSLLPRVKHMTGILSENEMRDLYGHW